MKIIDYISKNALAVWDAIRASALGTSATKAAPGNHTHDLSALGALMKEQNLADLPVAATARTNLGLGDSATKNVGTVAGTVAAGDHTHTPAEIGAATAAQGALAEAAVPATRTVNGHTLSADVTVTKGDVGLGNVDNTSDSAKPVSAATAAALAGKADLVGGKVTTAQLPDRALRTALGVPLRIAVFGDSTAIVSTTNTETNVETINPPFPGSGTTTVTFELSYSLCGLGPYNLVANGAWGGQTTRQMLDRSKNAYSTTRKSIQDIIALRPHVVILHGGSINDINTSTTYDAAVVAASISQHLQIVRTLIAAGIYVIDSGILGYSEAGAYLAVRRRMLLDINSGVAAAWASEGGIFWHWIEPNGLTHDGTGAYLSGLSSDGTHLTNAGNFALGSAENLVLNGLFLPLLPSAPIYDQMPDFLNASGGIPAKTGRDFGTSTINSSTCTADLYTVNFTTSGSTSALVYVAGADLKSMLSGGVTGDRYAIEATGWIENTDGTLHSTAYGRGYVTLRNADNSKVVLTNWWFHNSGKKLWTVFKLPCDVADLGSNSNLAIVALVVPTVGSYNLKLRPLRIFKI